jgi:hypothetical protein
MIELGAIAQAKRRAQDDAQREAAHLGQQADGLPAAPQRDAGRTLPLHRGERCAHAVALERRQEQPALLLVRVAVEHQHRGLADRDAQEPVALAGVQGIGRSAKHVAHGLRIRQHDQRAKAVQAQREWVAMARLAPLEQSQRVLCVAEELPERGGLGSARQSGVGAGYHVVDSIA